MKYLKYFESNSTYMKKEDIMSSYMKGEISLDALKEMSEAIG